jgi:hypothetical protein
VAREFGSNVWIVLRVGVKVIDQALVALPISERRIAGSGADTR